MKKEEKLFMREFYRKIGKAIYDYHMIEENDRILVGVSGGKDSLALLEVLASRAKDPKQHYSVVAAHVDIQEITYEIDAAYLQTFCDQLGIPFIHQTLHIDLNRNTKKPACFVCSWHRRKALFNIARTQQCQKLALGHHQDDAIESLLMSMLFNGTISSMPPRLSLFQGELTLIRPLIYTTQEDTTRYAMYRQFKQQIKNCPHERITHRESIRQLMEQITTLSPHARSNIFAAMRNIQPEYLP